MAAIVIAMIGDVGQQDDSKTAHKKALATGESSAYIEDLREEFVRGIYLADVERRRVYEHTISSALDGAARDCHGQGSLRWSLSRMGFPTAARHRNDQVRFELAYKASAAEVQIIAHGANGTVIARRRHRPRGKHKFRGAEPRKTFTAATAT